MSSFARSSSELTKWDVMSGAPISRYLIPTPNALPSAEAWKLLYPEPTYTTSLRIRAASATHMSAIFCGSCASASKLVP